MAAAFVLTIGGVAFGMEMEEEETTLDVSEYVVGFFLFLTLFYLDFDSSSLFLFFI